MVLNATVVAAMGTCVIWTIPIDLEEAEKKNQEHRESMAAAEARGKPRCLVSEGVGV